VFLVRRSVQSYHPASSCFYHLSLPKGIDSPGTRLKDPSWSLSLSLSLSLSRSQVGSRTSLTRTKHRVQTTQCHPRGSLQRLQVTCRIRMTLQSRNTTSPLHARMYMQGSDLNRKIFLALSVELDVLGRAKTALVLVGFLLICMPGRCLL